MLCFNLLFSLAFAGIPRISIVTSDLSQVGEVYVAPGLVSLIEFPQNIVEVRVGDPRSVKVLISQVSPKELTVYLSSSASSPSNIIVRSERRVFVLDIVPSRKDHQDYIKIRGAFGSPSLNGPEKFLESVKIAPSKTTQGQKVKVIKREVVRVSL